MKKIMNKNFIQKIVIAILIVLSFNFVMPTYSRADFGGVLLGPVIDLVAGLGDSIMALLEFFMDASEDTGFNSLSSKGFLLASNDFTDEKRKQLKMEPEAGLKEETINADELDQGWFGWGTYSIPIIRYGPEKIFANEIPALDANFINPKTEGYSSAQQNKSIAIQLRNTISNWYNSLRNLVIVLLLSILLYVAIRMIISSTASDKSKYKQMLMDWVVALCLLFFLHYIMSFTMTVTEIITDGLKGGTNINVTIKDADGDKSFKTNLTGLCRLKVQYTDLGTRMVYLIFYIALIVYTVKFTWEYMKRSITIAFLTLMAPLVTLTYPIDKISDGKAQAFNMWLKEYIFNALLQPFHLIIYTIFLGSAMEIVTSNPIYAIFFLAFITPAEKLLRKFFGFDKAPSAGSSFAGGFGGAAAFNAVKGAVNKGAAALNHGKGGNGGNNNIRTQKPVESNDAPQGYNAFANNENNHEIENNHRQENDLPNNEEEQTAQQRMLDAYDENYGTDEWDPQEREAMSREAYSQNNMTNDYSDEEYANLLRESGYSEDEIAREMGIENSEVQSNESEQMANSVEAPSDSQTEKAGLLRRTGRAIGGATTSALKYTGGQLKSRFATKAGWKKNISALGRGAARTLGAGVGATIGLGMGIAGDSLDDVLTMGTAGTTLGATAIGGGIIGAGRRIANSGVVQAASQGAREAFHGGVNEAAIARQDAQLRESGEIKEYIGNNITNEDGSRLSSKELKEYENRAIQHYDAGITDYSAIKKTLKLEDSISKELESNSNLSDDDKTTMAREQAETIAKIADKVDDKKLMTDQKYADGLQANFARGLQNANSSMSQSDVNKQAEHMMKLLKKYKKID